MRAAWLGPSAEGREVVAGVDAFLARFGYLRPHGVDFSEPGWAENPGAVWSAIGRLAVDGRAARRDEPQSVGERAAGASSCGSAACADSSSTGSSPPRGATSRCARG